MVAAAFLALAAVAAVWLALDHRPPEWDHANHLERAVRCAADLAAGDLAAIAERSSFYPPLVPCAAGVAFRLAPTDVASAQSVVLLFLGAGMGAVWWLGRAVSGPTAGVAAALLFGSAPFVVFSSLRFQLDLPLASMVALTLVALIRADGFRRRGWALAAGALLGLGMLTKPPFLVYVLPALVLTLARGRRAALPNAALALALAVLLGLPWYGPRAFGLPAQVLSRSFAQAAMEGDPTPLTWAGLSFYPTWMMNQVGVAAVVVFGIGLVVLARRREWFVLASLLLPFAVFQLVQNKDFRYTLPLVPLIAVVAAAGLAALPDRLGRGVGAVLVAAGALQVSGTAFGVPPPFTLPLLGTPWVLASPPVQDDWRHRALLARIAQDAAGRDATVSVVPNYAFFSVSNFRYYAVRDGLTLRFTRAWHDEPVGVEYMILKTGDIGPKWTAHRPRRIAERLAEDRHLARAFPVLEEVTLPDGSTASVRVRRLPADGDVSAGVLGRALEAAVRRRLDDVAQDVIGLEVAVVGGADLRRGRVERIEIRARAATVGELRRPRTARLRVRDVSVVLEELLVNPYSLAEAERLDLLDARRMRIDRAVIRADDFRAFLGDLRGFRQAQVMFEPEAVRFRLRQPGPDVSARVRFAPAADRPFAVLAEDVRVGGVPVPAALVNWVVRHFDPGPRMASRLPVAVELGRIDVTPDAIQISRAP